MADPYDPWGTNPRAPIAPPRPAPRPAPGFDPTAEFRDPTGPSTGYWYNGQWFDTRDPTANPMGMGPASTDLASLADPRSAQSSALYYGGDKDAAIKEMLAQQGAARAAQGRQAPLDMSLTSQSLGAGADFGQQLALRATGQGAPSPAMLDLQRGFDQSSALAMGGARAARGGLAARSLAGQTAQNIVTGNTQQRAIAANQLGNAERMQAIQQLGQYGQAYRDAAMKTALGSAGMEMKARGIGDIETQRREGFGQDLIRHGITGETNRKQQETDFLKQLYGATLGTAAHEAGRKIRETGAVTGGIGAGAEAAGKIADRYGQTPAAKTAPAPYNPDENKAYRW